MVLQNCVPWNFLTGKERGLDLVEAASGRLCHATALYQTSPTSNLERQPFVTLPSLSLDQKTLITRVIWATQKQLNPRISSVFLFLTQAPHMKTMWFLNFFHHTCHSGFSSRLQVQQIELSPMISHHRRRQSEDFPQERLIPASHSPLSFILLTRSAIRIAILYRPQTNVSSSVSIPTFEGRLRLRPRA